MSKREIIWVDTPLEAAELQTEISRQAVLDGIPWGEGPIVLVVGDPVRHWILRRAFEWETVTIPIPRPVRRFALWMLGGGKDEA